MSVVDELFRAAGVRGWMHARRLASEAEFGAGADVPVVLASVVKVPLVLEFVRQVAAGQLDPRERVRAGAADRLGGTGTAGCADDVELSLRDAAFFAMTVSDNTAADLLFDRVGVENIRSLVREWGLKRTRIVGGPREVLATMVEDVGAEGFRDLGIEQLSGMRALDPLRTNSSTPREMTLLLEKAWADEGAGFLRELMGQQVNWYRLAAAFPPEVRVWGKTGTLPGVRNEVGVVEYPDGDRYAIAVFTRVDSVVQRLPRVDTVIGEAARIAVTELRAQASP